MIRSRNASLCSGVLGFVEDVLELVVVRDTTVDVDGGRVGYRTSTKMNRAWKATGSICTDSSSGVIEGRYSSVGITESSKTSPKPVCCNSLEENLGINADKISRPRTRIEVSGVSRMVSRGGMNIFQ